MQVTNRIGNNCTSEAHLCSSDEGYSCSSASGHEELDFEDSEDYPPVEKKENEELLKTRSENHACSVEEGEIIVDDGTTVDIEDGEIPDTSNPQSLNTYSCRYYQKGKCVYGRDCRFFHLSDKGLYSMFDTPVVVHYRENFAQEAECFLAPSPPSEETETTWDLALKEAMERVKESRKRVALEKLCMTIQRDEFANKRTRPESPRKNRKSQLSVRKVRVFTRSKNDPKQAVAAAKPKSAGRERTSRTTYCLNWRDPWRRSKTPPKRKRWSPKSVSDCSCSRSRSHSSEGKSSCRSCHTPSPKRSRRSYSNKRRRRSTSSKTSSSSSSVSKKVSKRADRRKRKKRPRRTRSKIVKSYRRSPKTIFARKPNRKSSPDAKKNVRPSPVPSKQPAIQKVSLFPQSGNRSCSDMSISPLSDSSSNRKNSQTEDRPAFCHSSDRRLSDMSISPLSGSSDPDKFSRQIERTAPEVSKENLNSNVAPKGKSDDQEFTASDRPENTCQEKFPSASNNVSNSNIRTQTKKRTKDPLLMELMKYHGNFRRKDATVGSKARTVAAASKDADEHLQYERNVIKKEKRKSDVNQNRLSKKEMLLKRLQEIDAAIKRKKTYAQLSASKNP